MKDNNKAVTAPVVLNSVQEVAPVKSDVATKKPYHKKKKKPVTVVTPVSEIVEPTIPIVSMSSNPVSMPQWRIQDTPKVIILKQVPQTSWFNKQYNRFTKWLSL